MRKIIVDVENTTTKLNDKYADYSPYNANNKLVSIGWAFIADEGEILGNEYLFLNHNELDKWNLEGCLKANLLVKFKIDLANADVLIAHNAKYDMQWLLEAGFDLSHLDVEDTMIRECAMARGRSDIGFSLADCCRRYNVAEKGEIWAKYPDMQISEMPIVEVEEYGRGDIQACAELYLAQEDRLSNASYEGLHPTIKMMNEFCKVLTQIERSGIQIDEEALNQVEKQFTEEAEQLKYDLGVHIKQIMGDTKVNLDSPQQLSEVIYSRRIKTGKEEDWVKTFNIGFNERNKKLKRPNLTFNDFRKCVVNMTDTIMKTKAQVCYQCSGHSKTYKIKKDGSQYKKPNKCKVCYGEGIIYLPINEIAGLQMQPKNVHFTTVNGFSTGQLFLDELIEQAEVKGKTEAKEFLEKIQRLSSLSSYLSNFVGGIKSFKQLDNILHTNFNQCVTATGRLSSTKPNLQNMPRETTFPIRKVFKSRFKGGKITEVDFKTLEFRAAIHLANDNKGKKDILDGIDIHSQTSSVITRNGQAIGRQDAKSRTFKPLFGGHSGTDAERAYYTLFLTELYPEIGAWHKKLEEEALTTKMITLPTGRQFIFADVERQWHGNINRRTQVVNYPVQSFATADLLPISLIRLYTKVQELKLKSLIVLTVHDSVVVDTHPEEIEIVKELLANLGRFGEQELRDRYNIEPFLPFDVEVKIGNNLMELEKVA